MLARCRGLLILALLVFVTTPAGATLMPFTARLVIYHSFASHQDVDVLGSGVANISATAGGRLTGVTLPPGAFNVAAQNDRNPATTDFPRSYLTFSNGTGHFDLTAMGGGGSMPLNGVWRFCLLSRCDGVRTPPVTTTYPSLPPRTPPQAWPIGLGPIGNGGSEQRIGTYHTFTVVGQPWTKGFAINTMTTAGSYTSGTGFAHGPLSNTGTTAQAGGVLGLVTPYAVRSSLFRGGFTNGFAVLTIEFTPEPASGALVALGLGMLAAGRRRLRTR